MAGLRCAVLKLDAEGDCAARRVKFLELSTCEERRQFFHLEQGGDARFGRHGKESHYRRYVS